MTWRILSVVPLLAGCTVTATRGERPAYVEYVYTCREPSAYVVRRAPPEAPPADAVEEPGDRPARRSTWVPGHWDWRGRHRGFEWMPGRWERPPPRTEWVPPRVEKRPRGRFRFTPGHWRPGDPGDSGGARPRRRRRPDTPGQVTAPNRPARPGTGTGPSPARPPGPAVRPGALEAGRPTVPAPDRLPARLACTEVSPNAHIPGGVVTLRGRGFGTDASRVDVRLAGKPAADVRHVTDDSIVAKVPADGQSGSWTVSVDGIGEVTCEGRFTVRR